MRLGARFWKSLVGETMLAAVLVDTVARMMINIETATQKRLSIWPIRLVGSDTVSPTSCADAAVITTPSPANRNMVSGNPTICPTTWLFCESAKRLKSGMLSESVAQKPTIAVRPPKKYLRNDEPSGRDGGAARMSLSDACGQAQTISPPPTSS